MFSPEGKKILLFDKIVWLEISIYENLKNILNWRSTNLRADTLNLFIAIFTLHAIRGPAAPQAKGQPKSPKQLVSFSGHRAQAATLFLDRFQTSCYCRAELNSLIVDTLEYI